jgi:hypothetical protein
MPDAPATEQATAPTVHSGKPIGASGTKIIDGILNEEYNRRLQGERKWHQYERMENDPHIAEVEAAGKMPIIRADWKIERAEDKPIDREMEDFSNDMVFGRKADPFRSFLDPALDMLFDGFAWFEKIFVVKEWGPQKKLMYQWKQLAWRHARTVFRWYFDPDDRNLSGLQQYADFGDGNYRYQDIDVTYLLVFTANRRGQNYAGRGGKRFMYKPWRMLSTFEKILAIYYDRTGAGVPVVTVPKGTSEERKEALAEALGLYRSGERAYLILEEGEELAWHQGSSKGQVNMLPGMQFQRETIGKGVLAPFLNYGTTQTGSRALGDTMVDFFMSANQGVADHVAEDYNTHALHKLLALNFDIEKNEPPRLVAKGIDARDVAKQATAVKTYVDAGVIDPAGDLEMENTARKNVAMPEISDDALKLAQKENELELKRKAERLKKEQEAQRRGDEPPEPPTPPPPPDPNEPTDPAAPPSPQPQQTEAGEGSPPAAAPSRVVAATCTCGMNFNTAGIQLDLSKVSDDDEELQFAVIRDFVNDLLTAPEPARKVPRREMSQLEKKAVDFGAREVRFVNLAKRLDSKAGNFYTSFIEQIIRDTMAGKDPLSIRPKGTKPAGGLRYPQTVRKMRLEMIEGIRLGKSDIKDEAKRLAGKQQKILPEDESFSNPSPHIYVRGTILEGLTWLHYDKEFQLRKGRTKIPTEQQILDELDAELDARLHLGIQKIQNEANIGFTRIRRRKLKGREALSFLTNQIARVSEPTLRASVREALNIAYGQGREAEQFRLAPERLVRSEVFDGNICEVCAEKDGVVFRAGDPNFEELPDPECLGGSRCRGINIPLPSGALPGPQAIERAVRDRPETVPDLEARAEKARNRLQVLERGAIGTRGVTQN